MKIREVIQENDPKEPVLIQARKSPSPTWPDVEDLWEGALGDVPGRYWEHDCVIAWSAGRGCHVLDVGYIGKE